jgi:hypothetical protein
MGYVYHPQDVIDGQYYDNRGLMVAAKRPNENSGRIDMLVVTSSKWPQSCNPKVHVQSTAAVSCTSAQIDINVGPETFIHEQLQHVLEDIPRLGIAIGGLEMLMYVATSRIPSALCAVEVAEGAWIMVLVQGAYLPSQRPAQFVTHGGYNISREFIRRVGLRTSALLEWDTVLSLPPWHKGVLQVYEMDILFHLAWSKAHGLALFVLGDKNFNTHGSNQEHSRDHELADFHAKLGLQHLTKE